MSSRVTWFAGALPLLVAGLGFASLAGAQGGARAATRDPSSSCNNGKAQGFTFQSTMVFSSNRDNPTANPLLSAEIYLMNPDATNPRRLTDNAAGDGFAALAPDGKRIVFDSNRERAAGEPLNTSDLFLMNTDGSQQTHLTRGSSATWSPDCKSIAFHASASGTGTPIKSDPGAATSDSDIFVANVDDLLAGTAVPRNVTNSLGVIDDDPDWSPDGQSILYTAHPDTDNPNQSNRAELYVINADGTGTPQQLTFNNEEERGADWSPDGSGIEYMCRIGAETNAAADFEICVLNVDKNADGTFTTSTPTQLTDNTVQDLSSNWSPDGHQIVFHRPVAGPGSFQLFTMNSTLQEDGTPPEVQQLTFPPGMNSFADWGLLRVKAQG